MSLVLEPGPVVNAAGGLLVVALGAVVLRLRPRTRASVLLGVFAVGFGAYFVGGNLLTRDDPLVPLVFPVDDAAALVAAGALVLLAREFPSRMPPGSAWTWVPAAAVGLVSVGLGVPAVLANPLDAPAANVPFLLVDLVVFEVLVGTLWAVLVLFALRGALAARRGAPVGALAFVSAALVLWPAVDAGVLALGGGPGVVTAANLRPLPGLALVVALWLAASAWGGGRAARNVALLALGGMLAGMATVPFYDVPQDALGSPVYGLSRTFAVALLAYALLRHQLLGLDVKVRATIRQSTVAAAFVVVFFVASEGAQAFFAQTGDSEWVGIAAAGALVFVLAPLQRAAERLADAAVPVGGRPGDAGDPRDPRVFYLAQARVAWRDGALTDRERTLLRNLRLHLGLTADEAERLEQEAMDRHARERGRLARP